ncbi:MAG: cytochrome c [Gammaproteobacteria bacterium]|nr:cytochrome c [Gammaproteobacteria bacterium]MCF6362339.1 cytochrome c [Gammaproteobacteria bacterium]
MRRVLLGILLITGAAGTLLAADGEFSEQQAQGKVLFEARCVACHQLPEPDMLTENQWKRLLQLMQKRMQQADMPPLDEEEFAQVHAYLASQSK